jgi:hypothetical protein
MWPAIRSLIAEGRGIPQHVLVYADRLSGWSVVHQWRREPTTREVVQAAVSNFFELGVPMRFRSDDGPQFNAGIFQDTLWR